MKLVDKLSKKEITDLLGRCWMTHDGMWFYNCLIELGIENANKLNKAAIQSLAPIEVKRFKQALEIEKDKTETFEEFKYFFSGAAELLIPDFMNSHWSFPEENVMHWEFSEKKCFAYNGISMIGAIDEYECGVIFRIKCWLDSLNIKYGVTPAIDTCVVPREGNCSGDFRLFF
jgi:hypothetical protein